MKFKKSLAIIATVALFALPTYCNVNINANVDVIPSTDIVTGRLNHSYNGYPAGTPVYDGHGHNHVGQPKSDGNGALGHSYDNKHPLVNIPEKYVSSPHAEIKTNKKPVQKINTNDGLNKNKGNRSKTNNKTQKHTQKNSKKANKSAKSTKFSRKHNNDMKIGGSIVAFIVILGIITMIKHHKNNK